MKGVIEDEDVPQSEMFEMFKMFIAVCDDELLVEAERGGIFL